MVVEATTPDMAMAKCEVRLTGARKTSKLFDEPESSPS